MEMKRTQLRRSIRDKEVSQMRRRERQSLMNQYQDREQEDFEIQELMNKGDLSGLLTYLFQKDWLPFEYLKECSLHQLIQLVSAQLCSSEAATILLHLVKNHRCKMLAAFGPTAKSSILESSIGLVSNRLERSERVPLKQVNVYLLLIREIITGSESKCFDQILSWFPSLLTSSLYLELLARLTAKETQYLAQVTTILKEHPNFSMSLIRNALESPDLQQSSLALFMAVMDHLLLSVHFLETVLPSYMALTENALSSYVGKPCRQTRKYLVKVLEGLLLLLRKARDYQILFNSSLFNPASLQVLVALLSQEQLHQQKMTTYSCLSLLIELYLSSGEDISYLFQETQLKQLWRDLEDKKEDEITISVLQIFGMLVKSGSRRVLEWLQGCEVEWVLEVLQFSSNQEVAELADKLLGEEFRLQQYSEEDDLGGYV